MEKPDPKEIAASDSLMLKIKTSITDLNQIKLLVENHSTLTDNQSNILSSIAKVLNNLKIALQLINESERKEDNKQETNF